MRQTIFKFIWAYSTRQQLILLAITCLSFPLVYMILEVPKWIINDAISGTHFPKSFLGFQFEQLDYLFLLSAFFMGLIILNNAVKYVLNVYKGVVGERMLRRLRYQLFEATLRFRPRSFRRVSGDQLIPMITSEVEDLGHFFSEAVATPAFQGGSLVVYIVFIFVQNVWLGLVAVSLYPLQAWLIPHLQKQVSLLARDRVRNLRVVADRVGSSVSSSEIMHASATRRYHLADFSDHLHENYRIRFDIYKKKYVIKFLNNFLNQMPPFIFYAVGGYFVIQGELTLGALVVCISAYQDISGPWKDLLGYYQRFAMADIKYSTIIENFAPDDRYTEEHVASPADEAGHKVAGVALSVSKLALEAGEGAGHLSGLSFSLPASGSLALVGDDESGRSQVLQAVAGLVPALSGSITLDGRAITTMNEADIGARIGYVEPQPYLFDASLRANLAYTLRRQPLGPSTLSESEARYRKREAALTGNSPDEVKAPWTDFARAGVADRAALDQRMVDLLTRFGLGEDLTRLGLARRPNIEALPDFAAKILKVRAGVRAEILGDPELAGLVDLWDRETINPSAPLATNLLFGFAPQRERSIHVIAEDPAIRSLLRQEKLLEPLLALGAEAAGTMIRLFIDDPDATYSPAQEHDIPRLDLEAARPWLSVFTEEGAKDLDEAGTTALLIIALCLRPRRHRMRRLTPALLDQVLAVRAIIQTHWDDFDDRYIHADAESYIPALDVEHNLLQGRVRLGKSQGRPRIREVMHRWIVQEGLEAQIQRFGLDISVGVGGSALSAHQRRIVALVRALIARPPLLIADLGDSATQDLVTELRAAQEGSLLVGVAKQKSAGALDGSLSLKGLSAQPTQR
ncbi:MAG: ABC transporter transmembrane domain-containing protein [Pseudomonadota bacterium]